MTPHMLPCRIKWMLFLIVPYAFTVAAGPIPVEQPSTPEQLSSIITTCFQQRAQAVASSRGRAHLALEVLRPPESVEEVSKDTGIPPDRLPVSGVVEWYVDWWRKGGKNRYDISPDDKGVTRGYLKPDPMRVAVDAESGIYYEVDRNRAYTNQPPTKSLNPLGLKTYFDPEFLYEYCGQYVPGLIQRFLDDDQYRIDGVTTATIGDANCVGLIFRRQYPCQNGDVLNKTLSFWFAPDMAYSLVKAESEGVVASGTETAEPYFLCAYDAKYAASEETPGVWLITELSVVMQNDERLGEERLKVRVEEAHACVEISDDVFTFAGMGVPEGALFFDMRLSAREPVVTKYSSDMGIGLGNTHAELPPPPATVTAAPPAETTPPAEIGDSGAGEKVLDGAFLM